VPTRIGLRERPKKSARRRTVEWLTFEPGAGMLSGLLRAAPRFMKA
jgi:hypothetical protein